MVCPKCGFSQPDTNIECDRCGVIFAKIGITPATMAEPQQPRTRPEDDRFSGDRAQAPRPSRERVAGKPAGRTRPQTPRRPTREAAAVGVAAARLGSRSHTDTADAPGDVELYEKPAHIDDLEEELDLIPEPRHMDRDDWIVLAAGLVIALVVTLIPLVNHIFMTLVILVHEMGHTIVGWLFAYPSVPAFDLHYGGGITLHTQRSTALLVVIYLGMAFLIYTYRKNIPTVILLACLLIIHLLFSFTYFHEVAILFMGHGTELIIAGIFFYRAMSGAAVVHTIERPLYCAIGLFIVFADIRFAFGLMTSHLARQEYEDAKGGGHWMDFSRIAEDFLGVDLTSVAFFFFLCCLLPLVLGFLTFRYQEYLRKGIVRLWIRDPGSV